jgi:DNA helicase-2/ATP-dependent DNA helicase PcrA
MSDYLKGLTEAQHAAVVHRDGPLLVVAGPGSGKTRVVTCRVAHLIEHGVSDREILALTFTNKAAAEMRDRVRAIVPHASVWVGTFHRFCSQLLRHFAPLVGLRENFTIYDAGDSLSLLKEVIAESPSVLTHHTPAQIAHAISNAKNKLLTPDQLQSSSHSLIDEKAAPFYELYQRRLTEANAVDFDDLLMHIAHLLIHNPDLRQQLDARYRYVMVDEYQDTNYAQYCIARGLALEHPHLMVTGDPDQAIYGWRGADIENIMSFERDYPQTKIIRLEHNYRSTPEILFIANELIAHNLYRREKQLIPTRESGARVRLMKYENEREEAAQIAAEIYTMVYEQQCEPRDIAILYRINALSRTLEHALRDQGLPYQIVNGVEFYQRKEVKDILAYLNLINNEQDRVAFTRVVNVPPRGIGKKSLDRLMLFSYDQRITLIEAARQAKSIPGLTKRAATSLSEFAKLYDSLERLAHNTPGGATVEDIVKAVLDKSGYEKHLTHSSAPEDVERLANIQELVTAARQFDESQKEEASLERFLEQASLVNDVDALEDGSNRVTLMTMHAAKGLEFSAVYVIAIESEILPHPRAKEDPMQLEEERRLFFVAMTRAKNLLRLSFTNRRNFRGQSRGAVPSSFLMEIPREECDLIMSNPAAMHRQTWKRAAEDEFLHEASGAFDDSDFVHDDPGDDFSQDHDSDHHSYARVQLNKRAVNHSPDSTWLPPTDSGPDEYDVGMFVEHAQLGRGEVVSASGQGERRRVTIQFTASAECRTFVVAHAPLRPCS